MGGCRPTYPIQFPKTSKVPSLSLGDPVDVRRDPPRCPDPRRRQGGSDGAGDDDIPHDQQARAEIVGVSLRSARWVCGILLGPDDSGTFESPLAIT
jgi:hypothetical protein